MVTAEDPELVYPSDRLVVDVMEAAGAAGEEDVIRCLRYLREERGLLPGTKHGPRGFSWFKTVVADYFLQKADREVAFGRGGVPDDVNNGFALSRAEFNSMTEALEVEGPG